MTETSESAAIGGSAPARIAVVDDDASIRDMLRRGLQGAGYEITIYETGDAALDGLQEDCPDVLVSDLVMPGINGQELATAVRERCPGTILIFMSGYSADELRNLDITQVVFMSKPVSPGELASTIERLLGQPR